METCQWAPQVPQDRKDHPDLQVTMALMVLKEKSGSRDSTENPVTWADRAQQVTGENQETREPKAMAFPATLGSRDQRVSVGDLARHLMGNQVGWEREVMLASLV